MELHWATYAGLASLLLAGCGAVCGDGIVEANEECDDGNAIDADSCEADCTLPRCGNGIQDQNEVCFGPPQAISVGLQPEAIVADDFNADGDFDLALVNTGSNNVGVLINLGGGSFAPQSIFQVGQSPTDLDTGDFNGDGLRDIVVANRGDNSVSVLLGQNNNQFLPQTKLVTVPAPQQVVVAGLLGSSDIEDLIVSSSDAASDQFGVLSGAGDGTFVPQQTFFGGAGPAFVAVGNFNNDFPVDVVNSSANGGLVVSLGDGQGGFVGSFSTPFAAQELFLDAFDFTQDGTTDVILLDGQDLTSLSFLRARGDGFFNNPVSVPVGEAGKFTFADLNRDSLPDIAVASRNTDVMTVLLGEGDGRFGAPLTFPAGESPTQLTASDLDGDNRFDLAITNQNRNEVSILLQQAP